MEFSCPADVQRKLMKVRKECVYFILGVNYNLSFWSKPVFLCADIYISTNCDPDYFQLHGDLHKWTFQFVSVFTKRGFLCCVTRWGAAGSRDSEGSIQHFQEPCAASWEVLEVFPLAHPIPLGLMEQPIDDREEFEELSIYRTFRQQRWAKL